jgi:carboxyl-terminal processing protease
LLNELFLTTPSRDFVVVGIVKINTMFKQRIVFSFTLLFAVMFFVSCKKDAKEELATNVTTTATPAGTTSSATVAQLNQTAFLKTQDYYLWNAQLPASFNGAAFADPAAVMTDLRQYSTEAGFAAPVDRWSFAMKKTEWNQLSGGMSTVAATTLSAGDFGITVFFRADGDLRVRMVEPYSPAGDAGIRRGWRILGINGNSTMTIANADYIINNVYYSGSSVFKFQRPDGGIVDIALNAGHYTQKPLYLDTVYNTTGGKAGYMVYNSFLGDIDQTRAEYARVFTKFSQAGITNLIVDLRYNGGGYVDLQADLANYIINNSANGNIMMNQIYNSNHSNENSTTNFQKPVL